MMFDGGVSDSIRRGNKRSTLLMSDKVKSTHGVAEWASRIRP